MSAKGVVVFLVLLSINFSIISALVVDADYITTYPGKEGRVNLVIENNEDFDIKDISISLDLSNTGFTTVGSSEKSIDEIDENDDEDVSFTIRAATDITPGDYDILYKIGYTNADSDDEEEYDKDGTFGIRVSAETDIDFAVETKGIDGSAIVGKQGQISLEIINKGLGEIKSVGVEIEPSGFELISGEKIFIGSIDGDDTDIANFDVIFQSKNPVLKARVTYKDFDNNNQEELVNLPLNIYTVEEAKEKGLVSDSNSLVYIIIIVLIIILWVLWRFWKKRRKIKKKIE